MNLPSKSKQLNIELPEGDTLDTADFPADLDWQLKDEDGNVVDLTGYSARWEFATLRGSPTASLLLTQASGITLGASGVRAVAETSGMPSGIHYHNLKATSPGGKTTEVIRGELRLLASAVKS
jgi:hypothetical protein